MANKSDITRNEWMLEGSLGKQGYDWWWHSFTGYNEITGEKKSFYIEFFTCNPYFSQEKPIIVWNNPKMIEEGKFPSYLMVNVGYWGKEHGQLHRFFSLKNVKIKKDAPFFVKADDCFLSETSTKGHVNVSKEESLKEEVMSDAGSLSWNLYIHKQIAFNVGYGASRLLRKLNAFEMFWHAEGMKTLYSGEVVLNGQKYIVDEETCNGYADKNWGCDFTSPWIWLSSNRLYSLKEKRKLNDSVFDIGGGRPKVYDFALNDKLLGELYLEGKEYEFNFSKFWTFSTTQFHCFEEKEKVCWHIIQKNLFYELETKVICNKDEMLLINYESPDGRKRHNRLFNGGSGKGILKLYKRKLNGKKELIDTLLALDIGCEYGRYGKSG